MKKLFALLLTLALTIAAFTTLSAITVSAEEDARTAAGSPSPGIMRL